MQIKLNELLGISCTVLASHVNDNIWDWLTTLFSLSMFNCKVVLLYNCTHGTYMIALPYCSELGSFFPLFLDI